MHATLQWLFEQQYELTLTEVVEIRTRTTSSTDPETGETTTEEEDYEYYILKVKLRNKGLNSVISNSGLSEDDMERYRILLQTRGNRPDIFGNDIYATPGGEYTDYDIPGEALTDTRFANMIREAEKYLGYPYVWGGSSPSTSFDCSGFVSYVINHCGNGWSVGRLTANGLMGVCDIIPKSSAKPGDLIFFQGTYDTSGASHVGIYVGNGMMIHCGNPISYASIESNYWQQLRQNQKLKEGWRLSAKLDRIGADLEKARKKRAEWDARVKDLERRYREEENSEIHEMVHAANLTPDQLSELLRMFAADMAPKPDTINTMNEEEPQNEI